MVLIVFYQSLVCTEEDIRNVYGKLYNFSCMSWYPEQLIKQIEKYDFFIFIRMSTLASVPKVYKIVPRKILWNPTKHAPNFDLFLQHLLSSHFVQFHASTILFGANTIILPVIWRDDLELFFFLSFFCADTQFKTTFHCCLPLLIQYIRILSSHTKCVYIWDVHSWGKSQILKSNY